MIFQKIRSLFQRANTKGKTENTEKVGVIKYFNWKKGFGFIRSSQTTNDVFVHIKDVNDRVRKGDKVQFQVEMGDKGLRARNVELI
jgi:CspA family cold shock protein